MLTHSKLQSIIWTARIAEAETFYRDVLGLNLRTRSDGALVFDVGGGDLRVAPVPSTVPSKHTVMGFTVGDVDSVIAALSFFGSQIENLLQPETPLADAGIDSLDSLTILFAIEENFHISIPDDRARAIKTFGDMIDVVQELVPQP